MASPTCSYFIILNMYFSLLFYRVYNLSVKDRLELVKTGFITFSKVFKVRLTVNRTTVSVTHFFRKIDRTDAWTMVRSGSVFGPMNRTLIH
jgi:hypothetical protein